MSLASISMYRAIYVVLVWHKCGGIAALGVRGAPVKLACLRFFEKYM